MEWFNEIETYLAGRLKSGKTDGIKMLKYNPNYPAYAPHFIRAARDYIQGKFEVVDGVIKAKLTPVSVGIGSLILNNISTESYQADTHVKVGDFIIEGFYQCGFINIETPEWKASSNPIYVVPTEKWEDLVEPDTTRHLRGLYSEPPGKLNAIQKVQFEDGMQWQISTVKRWKEEHTPIYNTVIKHSAAHRAMEKLANVGWEINQRVLDAVNCHNFIFRDESKERAHKYTLHYAEQLKGKTFYYSPEFDYRGRIYFTMPYLNFQGDDVARGLLTFKDKKYVSERGLRWMKIHAASSFNESFKIDEIPEWCTADYRTHLENEGLDNISVDKMTLADRERWVDENWLMIVETAEAGHIHDCEKPVSFLAVAIELCEYEQADMYFSNLPIPVDGSNNGWQHLGAISRDPQTGNLVGLQDIHIQQDFYVQTAKKLIEITKDERRAEILAAMPMKKIRKGISKRGSMTRAYSAGAQKIAENMYQDCKKEGYHIDYEITEKDCKGFARDLVKAIAEVCPGPLDTMKYLQELTASQLEDGETMITWHTPSGFPVVYEAYHTRMPTIISRIKGINPKSRDQVGHKVLLTSTAPDRRKFMCGISPNFIHSQDAAHMHLVIDRFEGCFGAVHDSFSTHANEVDELLDYTKEVFIEMYDHPNYFNKIKDRIGGQAEQPHLGTLDIKEIKDADYFFA